MSNNNPSLMKTLKTINNVIGESSIKINHNNSTKKSKKYSQVIETHYYDNNKSHIYKSNHKNYEKKEKMLRLFQKKVIFRKWLYRLRLKLAREEYIQNQNKVKSSNFRQSNDFQNICYSDRFRIPPKHYVDRMRRILPNFEFNHIEEVRRDKYDIKLLWPVNNVLFPPDEKENRIHKIPIAGKNEYIEQRNSMKRLSKPKPTYSYENDNGIYNKYYKRRKISPKEALELCQRLNFKPSQHQNYDYINDYYNEENYEERQNRKEYLRRRKNKNSHNSKCRIEIEEDPNLSDLTAQLSRKRSSHNNSSNNKANQHDSSIDISIRRNIQNEINQNNNINISRTNISNQEKYEHNNKKTNKTNNNRTNHRSFTSSNEENTEIVSDSYLLDTSNNKISKKKYSSKIIFEEEEESSNENKMYSSNSNTKTNSDSHHHIQNLISDDEEEDIYKGLLPNTQNPQIKPGSYSNIYSGTNEEEESYKNSISKIQNSSYSKTHNKTNYSEEEIYNSTLSSSKNEKNKTSSYTNITLGLIEEEEEKTDNQKIEFKEEEEFSNKSNSSKTNNSNNSIKNNLNQNLKEFEEEEEESPDNQSNKKTQNKQNTNNSYENTKTEIFEEEEEISDYSIIINNNIKYSQKSSNSHQSVKTNEEEDYLFSGSNIIQNTQTSSSTNKHLTNKIFRVEVEEEEEEISDLKAIKNSQNSINSYLDNQIEIIEEEEEENSDYEGIINNNQIMHDMHHNIITEINEEEEDFTYNSNNRNYITKTTSKVIHTSTVKNTTNNYESPIITHTVKQFTHSSSKNYDNMNDELFSDSSVDKGILVGNTSSGIGPISSKNNVALNNLNTHSSASTDSFV